MMRRGGLVAVVVAAVITLTACSTSGGQKSTETVTVTVAGDPVTDTVTVTASPPSSSAATAGAATQSVTLDGATADFTLGKLSRIPVSQYGSVKGTLYGATVTIIGRSGSFDVKPLFFTARSAAGDTYSEALGAADNQLATTTVKPGQTIKGLVAFDVTAGRVSVVLFESPGLSDQLAEWDF